MRRFVLWLMGLHELDDIGRGPHPRPDGPAWRALRESVLRETDRKIAEERDREEPSR